MKNINSNPEPLGETTDVESWLMRAGLKFSDLGNDATSKAIRQQWREYQLAVHKCSVSLGLSPERIQLSGVHAHLRIPTSASIKCEM